MRRRSGGAGRVVGLARRLSGPRGAPQSPPRTGSSRRLSATTSGTCCLTSPKGIIAEMGDDRVHTDILRSLIATRSCEELLAHYLFGPVSCEVLQERFTVPGATQGFNDTLASLLEPGVAKLGESVARDPQATHLRAPNIPSPRQRWTTNSCDSFPLRLASKSLCGTCTPCLLRQQPLYAAELNCLDPSDRYAIDVISPDRSPEVDKLRPLRMMLSQVEALRHALGDAGSCRRLTMKHPELREVSVDLRSHGQDSEFVRQN